MTQELQNLLDARDILAKAYMSTIGMWAAHNMVWHAIEYIDRQTAPILEAALREEVSA